MKQFSLELKRHRPIIELNGERLLIATGWPYTLHRERQLKFMGRSLSCFSTMAGVTLDHISSGVGEELAGVVGMDVLQNFDLEFDYEHRTLLVDEQHLSLFNHSVFISNYMYVPIVKLELNHESVPMYLDSSANLSFLTEKLLPEVVNAEFESDFLFEMGMIKTSVVTLEGQLSGQNFELRTGVLPQHLEMGYNLAQVRGLLGSDLFYQSKIRLSMRRSLLSFTQGNE